jgi:hypothetical protein
MHLRSSARAIGPCRLPRSRRLGVLVATAGLTTMGLAIAPAASAAVHQASGGSARPAASASAGPAPGLPLSQQRPLDPPRAVKLPHGVRQACPVPDQVGVMQCSLLIRTDTPREFGVSKKQTPSGYGPTQLQSAYSLATAASGGGTGETVAVVAAYNDPKAASDLAAYRAEYGLPACDTATGAGCVTVENQEGSTSSLPPADASPYSWEMTESVDLDMISAICPNCSLLLIEATSNSIPNLGTAENTAAATKGVAFIANSWNGPEFSTEGYYDNAYFNHPGVAITVASGLSGYGTTWPSTSQFVTTVGGTTLTQDTSVPRGWTETVWNDGNGNATGSGCSLAEPKPSWQTLDDSATNGCLNRTENDVSAVADPQTGVAVYDSYKTKTDWSVVGGTSVSAPIISAVYALAGTPTPGTYPASYLYQGGHAADLYDVTSGSNGTCEPARQYLCNAETGYDGPTGLGTPDGTTAFANSATGNLVTIPDPGTQDVEAGKPVFVALSAHDSAGLALTYSATGLPSGLSINASSGRITGTLGSASGTHTVTVTAKDSTGASGSVTFTMVVVESLTTDYDAVSGLVPVDIPTFCMDDPDGTSIPSGAPVEIYTCNSKDTSTQFWTFEPDGSPGQPDGGTGQSGTVTIHGKCMDLKNGATKAETYVVLDTCDGATTEQWMITGSDGQLYNTAAGYCLADPGGSKTNGHQLWVWNCDGGTNQAWTLPASPVQSGVTGICMDDNHDVTTNGNKVQAWACNGKQAQQWADEPNETLQRGGACLTVTGSSMLDGATVVLETCDTNNNTNGYQRWIVSGGELINVNSGRCLSDPGNSSTNGTALVQEDCYGESGQIWALT